LTGDTTHRIQARLAASHLMSAGSLMPKSRARTRRLSDKLRWEEAWCQARVARALQGPQRHAGRLAV